jgi:hypothetical protein
MFMWAIIRLNILIQQGMLESIQLIGKFIQKAIYILPDRKYGNMLMVVIRQSGGDHDST